MDAVYMEATTGDDRAGRLADDRGAQPRGRAVLRRHLLPRPAAAGPAGVPAGARRTHRGVDEPPRRGRQRGRGRVRRTCARRSALSGEDPLDEDLLAGAVRSLAGEFDAANGGFGTAPKFPPSMVLEFLLRHAARTGAPNASRDGRPDAARDGPRRPVRPARRRVRPLLRRPRLGGAALREDALRQRAAARRLHPLVAADRRPAGRAGGPADRRLPAAPSCAPTRAGSPRRWTPTPRAWRASSTCGPPTSWSRCSGTTTAPGPPRCSRSPRTARSSTGVDAAAARRAGRRRSAGSRCAAGCSRPGSTGCARPATTRWWPPGTGWRSRPSPRRACCWASRGTSTRRSTRRRLIVDVHLDGRHLRRVSRDGVVGRARRGAGGLRLRRVRRAGPAVGHRRRDLAGDRAAPAGRRADAVRRRRRWLVRHRRRTPSRCCPGPATPPTTPARPGTPRWCTRCSATPRSPAPDGTATPRRPRLRNVRALAERVAAVRRLVAGRRGGRAGRPARGRGGRGRRRPGPRRAGPRRPRVRRAGPGRGGGGAVAGRPGESDDPRTVPLLAGRGLVDGRPRRTSAGGWCATGRSPTRPSWPARSRVRA